MRSTCTSTIERDHIQDGTMYAIEPLLVVFKCVDYHESIPSLLDALCAWVLKLLGLIALTEAIAPEILDDNTDHAWIT